MDIECENPKQQTGKTLLRRLLPPRNRATAKPKASQNPNHTKQFTTQANSTNTLSSSVSSFLGTHKESVVTTLLTVLCCFDSLDLSQSRRPKIALLSNSLKTIGSLGIKHEKL